MTGSTVLGPFQAQYSALACLYCQQKQKQHITGSHFTIAVLSCVIFSDLPASQRLWAREANVVIVVSRVLLLSLKVDVLIP